MIKAFGNNEDSLAINENDYNFLAINTCMIYAFSVYLAIISVYH